MNRHRFYVQLGILTAAVLGALFVLQLIPAFQTHFLLSIISLVFFSCLSLVMYLLGAKAAISKDKNAFTRLIMVFTFIKMVLSVSVVVLYFKWAQPEGKLFILPFILIYLVFTVYETMFMSKLGKIKAR